jgi:hypothetical protein
MINQYKNREKCRFVNLRKMSKAGKILSAVLFAVNAIPAALA